MQLKKGGYLIQPFNYKMVFSSLIFLYIFLPLNLILYYISKNAQYRNLLLIAFSLTFYAWGEPFWIFLMIFSAFVDYCNALFIEHYRKWAFVGLISTLVINFGLLIGFKYSAFIYENLNFIFNLNLDVPKISLPIGISFYTFQTVSYVVDVYKKEVKAQTSFMNFLLFVSLYHQLVAGPIVRYSHIADEIDNRKFKLNDLVGGINRFCVGLFKKVCIANVAAEFVAKYLDADFSTLTVGEAWFGILMFSIQIYFDFSGYSDMAIGLGKMFGFHYHENFNYPYIANSATDFWRRWHISLGTFFRDYVYIPLGGNKKNGYFNLFVVWFLTGLWHGASWNFILWGVYFGVLILIERLFLFKILNFLPKVFSHLYLLFVVVLGWALFYFTDFKRLSSFFELLFGMTSNEVWNFKMNIVLQENMFWIAITLILCLPIYLILNRFTQRLIIKRKTIIPIIVSNVFHLILLLLATAMLVGNSYNPFIYYRF